MALGIKVGLGLCHILLDGDPAPNGHSLRPNFRPMSVVAKRLDGTEVGLGPDEIVLNGDAASPLRKRGTATPTFQPMSIVAKRLDGSRCHLVRR